VVLASSTGGTGYPFTRTRKSYCQISIVPGVVTVKLLCGPAGDISLAIEGAPMVLKAVISVTVKSVPVVQGATG
jgi:hypothetical protein